MLKKVLLLSISLGTISNSISMDRYCNIDLSTLGSVAMGISTGICAGFGSRLYTKNTMYNVSTGLGIGIGTYFGIKVFCKDNIIEDSKNSDNNHLSKKIPIIDESKPEQPINTKHVNNQGNNPIIAELHEEEALYEAAKQAFMMSDFCTGEVFYNDEGIKRLNDIHNGTSREYNDLWFRYIDNEPLIKYLIHKGANVNITDNDGNTALHLLFQRGYSNSSHIEFLLLNGANLDAKNHDGKAPIDVANTQHKNLLNSYKANPRFLMIVEKGGLSLVKKHLDENPSDINVKDRNDSTPLHLASKCGCTDIVDYLISKGVDINAKNKDGNTPLHIALHKGCLPRYLGIAQLLISKGANINDRDEKGFTPLHHALHFASRGKNYDTYISLAQDLINRGANINAQCKIGNTALHNLLPSGNDLTSGKDLTIEFLITNGADPSIRNSNGKNIFDIIIDESILSNFLCAPRMLNIFRELLRLGDRQKIYQGLTGDVPFINKLITSYENKKLDFKTTMDFLILALNSGATITGSTASSSFIKDMLLRSINDSDTSTAQLLIEKGADINFTDNNGKTPLHLATCKNNLEVVQQLINLPSIRINTMDNDGMTPLHWASQCGYTDIVDYLISKGAIINIQNANGYTPFHVASFNGHLSVVELLITKGTNINIHGNNDETPLHIASERGHLSVVEYLINKGANINAQDKYGNTPLHLAAQSLKPSVELLVTNGADINAKNNRGETPISILLSKVDLLHSDILSNWKLIAWLHKYMKENGLYAVIKGLYAITKDYEQENNLITAAMCGDIDFWREWDTQAVDKKTLKESLQYGLFIAAANGQINFFNDIYILLTTYKYNDNIDLSTIRDNNGNNVIDISLYSLNPEMIRSVQRVDETTFNDHLNTNLGRISSRLTNLFSDKYINLVTEINNPRNNTNAMKLLEEMNNLMANYMNLSEYLANKFGGKIVVPESIKGLKNLERIDAKGNVYTTLTGKFEGFELKGSDVYKSIMSRLS